METNQSFHPSVIVNDHFDNLINHIDVHTESLLEKRHLDDEFIDELNILRENQIKLIKEIKKLNLKNVKFEEENFQKEWFHIFNNTSLDYQQKIEKIKPELIKTDCVLVYDTAVQSGMCLWTTNWFCNTENLKFLK
jgi:hypothetical protein